MAEEQVDTTQESVAQEEASTSPQEQATPQPALDLDATVKIDGQEIPIRDLVAAREEAAGLKEYAANARVLVNPGAASDTEREQAIRYLMTQEGYPPQKSIHTWSGRGALITRILRLPPNPRRSLIRRKVGNNNRQRLKWLNKNDNGWATLKIGSSGWAQR